MEDERTQPVEDGVDFVIGGHRFRVPIPSLFHAKTSGKFLPPFVVAQAEQAIDVVIAHSDDGAGLDSKDLLKGCSLGEAVKLAEGWRKLMKLAGLPMVPTAPPAPTASLPSAGALSQKVELDLPAPAPAAERSPNFKG